MHKIWITSILLFFYSFNFCFASSDSRIDSLIKVSGIETDPRKKAELFLKLAVELATSDNNRSVEYAQRGIEQSLLSNYTEGLIEGHTILAVNERNKGNYSIALEYLKKSLSLSQKLDDQEQMANCMFNIGDVYSTLKNYEKAIEHYEKANAIYIKSNNKIGQIIGLSRIGNRNMDIGNALADTSYFLKAISIYEKAKSIASNIGDQSKFILMNVNLADAYNILGNKTSNKYHIFHSIDYSLSAIKLSRSSKNLKFEAISFLNLGESYENLGVVSKAIHNYEVALSDYTKMNDVPWIINSCKFLANAYYKLENYSKAIEYLERGLSLAKARGSKEDLMNYYQIYSDLYLKKNDYKNSLLYYRQYSLYKDSILNENASINLARLQTELDVALKDSEIELLTKSAEGQENKIRLQNIQRNSLIAAIVGVFILLLFIYYRYREKQKSELQILKAKNIAEQAKEAQELFLANTSHEIRTPMNGIIGMTHQLQDTKLDDEQQEYVDAITESSENLLTIINDLLDLSKIRAGKIEFDKKVFKLPDLFKNLLHNLKFRAAEKNIQLGFHIDKNIPEQLIGDSVRLNQILLNITGNALKFTEHGSVFIRVDKESESEDAISLIFSVSDTGIGIPEEKIRTIFDSFTQVNAKSTKKYAGTGLGLAITKDLVEQQGGAISVESVVGQGTKFIIHLNFEKNLNVGNSSVLIDKKKGDSSSLFNKIKILIVDDNKVNQKVAALALKKWKAKTVFADDAKTAIEILKNKQIDIVLMDLSMPEMDGIEATSIIRNELKNNVPVIAITAAALIGEREKCLSAGMNDYISKPYHPDELVEKIKKLVPSEKLTTAEMLIDLKGLYQRADGDIDYLNDILASYRVEMPLYLDEFEKCFTQKRTIDLAAQAHKMRSPLSLLGAKKVVELLLEIETSVKIEASQIDENKVSEVIVLIKQTIIEVELELELIQS